MASRIVLFLLLIFTINCGASPFLTKDLKSVTGITSLDINKDRKFFAKEGLYVEIKWLKGPVVNEESQAEISFYDEKGILVDPEREIHFYLWMDSMGHGSSPVEIKQVTASTYFVSRIHFIMAGEWQIRIDLLDAGQKVDGIEWDLNL